MKNSSCGYLIGFILFLSFYSCGKQTKESVGLLNECSVIATKNVTVSGDTVIVCDVASVKESFLLPLSLLVDSLEIIKLDNREEALIGKSDVAISENFIGAYDYKNHSYKLFTRQGKYLRTIGAIGQGPGEYRLLYDNQIDEVNNYIYLFPWTTQKVLAYDLDGNFLQDILLPRLVHKGCFKVDTSKRRMTVLNLPFTGNSLAWVQDFNGNVICEKPAPQLELLPDYSNEIINRRYHDSLLSFSFLHALPVQDSLYHYDGDKNALLPVFTTNFGDNIPIHYYVELPQFYNISIIGPSTDPDYTGTVNRRIIIDKHTLKGGYYQLVADRIGGIILPFDYNEYGCVANIEPEILRGQIEKRLSEKPSSADKEVLIKLKDEISEDDNNYILLGKWK